MEGGHRCFDPRFGDSFGTEFDFSDQPGTVDEALRWKLLGTSQPTEGLVREVKFSSKGITKPRVKAPMTTFHHVLNAQRVEEGTLKRFRARNNGISIYEQGSPIFIVRGGFLSFELCRSWNIVQSWHHLRIRL
jgi:hypothetical protein